MYLNIRINAVLMTVLFFALLSLFTYSQPRLILSLNTLYNKKQLQLQQQQQQQQHLRQQDVQDTREKFMTYLPHSGLHNQRISLVNALIIAKALNRTLLMPELNIGNAPSWASSDILSMQLEKCPRFVKKSKRQAIRSLGCQKFRKYKPVDVESIFDLSSAHELGIRTEQRKSMDRQFFNQHAANNKSEGEDVYFIHDYQRYSYQIHDHDPNSWRPVTKDDNKYEEHISLAELRARPEVYLSFGSLFGMSRLQLHEPELVWLREHLHRTTGIHQNDVVEASNIIMAALGEEYTSVHLRQGDGVFRKTASETIDQVELALQHRLSTSSNANRHDVLVTQLQHTSSVHQRLDQCRSIQHLKEPKLEMIYLATDAMKPRKQFPQMFKRYPCIFTLGDFYTAKILQKDKRMNGFMPMIDAEVASHASLFIGTPKSTYSAYVRYRNQHYRTLDFFAQYEE